MPRNIQIHVNEKRQLHRDDGPAVIYANGWVYWYYHGHNITNEVVVWAEERGIDLDYMSDIDRIALKFAMAGFAK